MAGKAPGIFRKIGIRALQQRQAVLNRAADGVVLFRLQRHGSLRTGLGAGLHQQVDDRRVPVLFRDIEHGESGVACLRMPVFGIHVGSAFDQQFDDVQRQQIRDRRVHQRGPAGRVKGIHIGAMIQHQADGFEVAKNSRYSGAPGCTLAYR